MLFRASNFLIRFCLAGIFQLLLCSGSLAQSKKISGIITREDNTPLFGATITVKNSNASTITDSAGSFSMHVNEGEVLLVSFIGYLSKEIKITNQTALTISLTQTAINLDEILVTGYTSQRVKEITGSVAVVKPKDLVAVPSGQ
ncbi:MAG TPA: carboxypeptidase-like regulatory domain-containing protein, partial [Chitinophagaceae bacterium]|nr:carboxypeptidase-like regulatory domain-containing protein [Chitinophagaceae bacterium]